MTRRARHAPERLGYIDGLRGLGAVAVALFWHYQHFTAPIQPNAPPFSTAPFFAAPVLHALYTYGYLAVDLFFLISGMVFQHVYGAGPPAGARLFFWHRVARLYPLHLAGLLLTAILAWGFAARFGHYPIYTHNSAADFVRNLLFLQGIPTPWGQHFSFDGPGWSLSVEAAMYVVFFLVLRGRHWAIAPALVMVGLLTWLPWQHLPSGQVLPQGLVGFFLGVVIYRATRRPRPVLWLALPGLAVVGFAYVSFAGRLAAAHGVSLNTAYPMAWAGFGMLLLLLRLWPALTRPLGARPLLWLGDRSLSIYLLHVPIQIGLIAIWNAGGHPVPFGRIRFWLFYAALVLAASAASYRWFEVPARRWLRNRTAT